MDYYKLLEEYLNQSVQYAYDNYTVLSWDDMGVSIKVYYRVEDNMFNSDTVIPLFDLISFVYSKI